jgi:hypothetical protein
MVRSGNGSNGHGTNGAALRAQIFEVLRQSTTPEGGWVKILTQCTAQIQNRAVVEQIARECNLTLSGFRSDSTLEFYFDLARGTEDLGYISKGWTDPGFRIGNLLFVPPPKTLTVITNAFQIMKLCATNGIGVSVQETSDGILLHMDGVLYSEGFNRETFANTLDTLTECLARIRSLIGLS